MNTSTTTHNLSDATLTKVQNIIQMNIDSQKGFSAAAKDVKDPGVATLFRRVGGERSGNVAELQKVVSYSGEEPQDDGSVKGAMHRAWMNARSAITGGDSHTVLAEAERGEDAIKELYEDTLKEASGSPVYDVLQRQYVKVKASHDEVRDLRDAMKKV